MGRGGAGGGRGIEHRVMRPAASAVVKLVHGRDMFKASSKYSVCWSALATCQPYIEL